VRAGLGYLRRPIRQGILSLIGVCDLQPEQITAEHIGFGLAPRLNAAGRLESALAALDLLLCNEPSASGPLAQELNRQNYERQQLTRAIQTLAEQQAMQNDPDGLLLFAAHNEYNSGVIGLAASRLTEQYYRPAIVATMGEEFTRGSCRSIPEFHITDALDECAELLIRHGGHAAAAGFTVRTKDLPELVERLRAIARRELGERDLRPTLRADAEAALGVMEWKLWEELKGMEPTGASNPGATFVTRGLRVLSSKVVGKDSAHLKLRVVDSVSASMDAIAFRQGHWAGKLPAYVDLLYKFEMNAYNGYLTPQLNVKDIRPAR
jgi:single-stranded-DNA-specific exonuclease